MIAHGATPILNVSNFAESIAWFERLGWKKLWDWGDPHNAADNEPWNVREMHIRHPDGHVFRISKGIECEENALQES
jgi:hypothetical protein